MADEVIAFLSQRINSLEAEVNKRFDTLSEQIGELYGKLSDTNREIGEMKGKIHSPGLCPLSPEVNRLTLSEARRGGMLAVVGVIAGLVASGVVAGIIRFIPQR